jgi:hypothetical protein
MKLILNEKEYIDKVLNNEIENDNLSDTVRTLVKYYVVKGNDKVDIADKIEVYLKDRLKEKYRVKKWESYISSVISSTFKTKRNYERSGKTFQLNEINNVFVSDNELERIKLIENLNAEKIAFVLLVYGKINQIIGGDGKVGTYCNREFFKDCGLSFSNANRNLINHLKQLGYVTPSDNHQSSFVEINIADEDSAYDEEDGINICEFRDFVLLYEKWRGIRVDYCECGVPIRISSNRNKYCKECSKVKRREKQREWDRNNR